MSESIEITPVEAIEPRWYALHVLSGQEKKVKDSIEKRIKTDMNRQLKILKTKMDKFVGLFELEGKCTLIRLAFCDHPGSCSTHLVGS